ncbi:MAG: DUF2125 domain-containing protein [Pseudomonadota bacterium]
MSAARPRRRMGLIAPFAILGLLFAVYSAYWVWMAGALTDGVEDWIEDQRALGYRMEHQGLEMRGYPLRFSLHVERPEIEPPRRLWAWRSETLILSAMPYNLNHVIAQSPGEHQFNGLDGRNYSATSTGAAASLSWNSETLKRFSLVIPEATVLAYGQPYSRIEELGLHVSPMPDAPEDIRILAQAALIDLPRAPADAPWLGEALGPFRVPIAIENGFAALNTRDPLRALHELDVQMQSPLAMLDWGPLLLRTKTTLGVDAAGRPEGIIELRFEEIEALEAAMKDAGELTIEIQAGLAALKGLTRDDSFAPITFEDGQAKIGLIPLGDLRSIY